MEPNVEITELWLPKEGNSESEYEDASAVQREDYLFAVADGATETSFSGVWAKILTKAFVEKRLADLEQETILPLVHEWDQEIAAHTQNAPLPWYAEEKLRKGAFSSLLGLKIDAVKDWSCTFVGDSCLFQIRDGKLHRAIPYETPTEFHNRPALISTDISQNEALEWGIRSGEWEYNDYFFLMTDALAECFLSDHAHLMFFIGVKNPDKFQHKIKELRMHNQCRNDDSTLVRVHIIPPTEDINVDLA